MPVSLELASEMIMPESYQQIEKERDALKAEVAQLGQHVCGECIDKDGVPTGWCENAVEGRHVCGCIEESEPYQALQAEVAELRAFDAEVDEMVEVCPECGSWDTEEIHYAEDFGSRKCISCGFSGGPGEDFETYYMVNARSRRVGKELAAKDATIERLRGLLLQVEDDELGGLDEYWVTTPIGLAWLAETEGLGEESDE